MLALMNLPALAGIACLAWVDSAPGLLLFLALTGISSAFVQTSVSAVWVEVHGTAQLGTIRSFTVMLMVGSTAAGPAALGILLDTGWSAGAVSMLLLAAGLAAAVLAALAAGSRRARGA